MCLLCKKKLRVHDNEIMGEKMYNKNIYQNNNTELGDGKKFVFFNFQPHQRVENSTRKCFSCF